MSKSKATMGSSENRSGSTRKRLRRSAAAFTGLWTVFILMTQTTRIIRARDL